MEPTVKYLSLFTGIGGFELGIERASKRLKIKTGSVGYSEIDKYAIEIYQKHFKDHKNYGDITKIAAETLPDFDLIVGGFPCQSFSIAGRREGFADTRGTLFFDIARIIAKKKPRLLLLENVKGLLSHDGGKTFATIIRSLCDLGYDVQWQVLNSKDFGVPQNRERVFIVGHLRGQPRPEVFPIRQSNGVSNEKPEGKAQATHPIRAGYKAGQGGNDYIIHNVYGGFGEKKPREFHDYSPTIRTPQGGGHIPMVVKVQGDLDKRKTYLGPLVGALAANPTSDNTARITDGPKIRRLTPKECERLQGFPDNWTAGISDTQRYKTLGNAVTVNVIEAIMYRLLA